MPGLVLVVDDVPANVKLLEAKLSNEYYDVITAADGFQALEVMREKHPDLVLLDVMMPGMDGFETCEKIKEDETISHTPVVMVTALTDVQDRVRGLDAGADDFLTKPINDTALFARVKSLVRMKGLLDELRLRDKTGSEMGVLGDGSNSFVSDVAGAKILLIDDDAVQTKRLAEVLGAYYQVEAVTEPSSALNIAEANDFDLVILSTMMMDMDGLRLASQMKSQESLRHVPIIMLVDEDEEHVLLKGLEMGLNDYLIAPVDHNEMLARVKTQIRRKKYQEALKSNYKQSISMAITDGLTGLYNRHYLNAHLNNMVQDALAKNKPISLMIMDMDHFKSVNDTYGHDVGDQILQSLAKRIVDTMRGSDLIARFGGEEFVVLMPETDFKQATDAAERVRRVVEATAFEVKSESVSELPKTVSIGVASLNPMGDNGEAMLKRADNALYDAKNGGRNKVVIAENV